MRNLKTLRIRFIAATAGRRLNISSRAALLSGGAVGWGKSCEIRDRMTPKLAPRPKFWSSNRLSHLRRKIASHAHGIFSAGVIAASRASFMETEASIEGESRLIAGAHFQMDEKRTRNPR
jgi:hypothetical protein